MFGSFLRFAAGFSLLVLIGIGGLLFFSNISTADVKAAVLTVF